MSYFNLEDAPGRKLGTIRYTPLSFSFESSSFDKLFLPLFRSYGEDRAIVERSARRRENRLGHKGEVCLGSLESGYCQSSRRY